MTSTHLAIGCGGNYTPDGKIRGKTLLRLGILAEDWDVSLEVLHELEDMIDARLKELDDQNS